MGDFGLKSVSAIDDCWSPGIIAAAVYSERKYAESIDAPEDTGDVVPFKREITELYTPANREDQSDSWRWVCDTVSTWRPHARR